MEQEVRFMSLGVVQSLPVAAGWDDPLDILPCRKPQQFSKDQSVYTAHDRAESLFLVVDGFIKLSRISDTGKETVIDFCAQDSFFGESCLLGAPYRGEIAVAQEDTSIMEWTTTDLHSILIRLPKLGPSLLRVLARKLQHADARIESLAIDPIAQRLIKALLRLADELGKPNGRSTIHIMPVTHELLARYVGTSREIITQHMSQFRRKGLVRYSRAGIEFDPGELRALAGEHSAN